MSKNNKLDFYKFQVVLMEKGNRLMLRTFISDKEKIKEILKKITKDGFYQFLGRAEFLNRKLAIVKLMSLGFITYEDLEKRKK